MLLFHFAHFGVKARMLGGEPIERPPSKLHVTQHAGAVARPVHIG